MSHALTADHLAEVQQAPILNPSHAPITWTETAGIDRTIVASDLPKLCGVAQPDAPREPLRDPVSYLFLALILLGPVALALRREGLRGAFTLIPLVAGIFSLDFAFVSRERFRTGRSAPSASSARRGGALEQVWRAFGSREQSARRRRRSTGRNAETKGTHT